MASSRSHQVKADILKFRHIEESGVNEQWQEKPYCFYLVLLSR
jgi:hypothetical protein